MKTNLPDKITTIEGARAFLNELHRNGEAYHPEDDASDMDWPDYAFGINPDGEKLNGLMCDIYNLAGNDGRHAGKMVFEPCEYLNVLDVADRVITLDGVPVTLGEYVMKNDWEAISSYISHVAHLEEDEDFYLPVDAGFITIKRIIEQEAQA